MHVDETDDADKMLNGEDVDETDDADKMLNGEDHDEEWNVFQGEHRNASNKEDDSNINREEKQR